MTFDTTHKGKDNIYVFTWKGKRVAMREIPLPPKSTKKKVSSLISYAISLIETWGRVLLKREGQM